METPMRGETMNGSKSRQLPDPVPLAGCPAPESWDDWTELDPAAWPRRVERRYRLVPTLCFNCESGCGLLAYVDLETLEIRKFEGNPLHPGSRGRTCAKGPATLNQIRDPERILYPLRREGPRGGGRWKRISWDEALDQIALEVGKAMEQGRGQEIVYHVGRPGHDGTMDRVLQSWGIDGHNSHTNICSSGARLGYSLWQGIDRCSADFENARFILLLSAHLESGHYFNPHAQRIVDGKSRGAKLAVVDPRLSNTASMADYWLPAWPGTEGALLLAIASQLLATNQIDRDFLKAWINWEEYLLVFLPDREPTFDLFLEELRRVYAEFTPEFAARECKVEARLIVELARDIGAAGSAFSSTLWRGAAAGNLGGWQVARSLFFLHVLTGSVGTKGGLSPNQWHKFVPRPFDVPPPQKSWNELLWPREYPLSHHEMSYLLPHFLQEGRGRLSVYFTRVYNPVWTNPDGAAWLDVLRDTDKVGLHVALTPIWSETAWFADLVLPMGLAPERHDLQSQETHAGRWIGFRQPVQRVVREQLGQRIDSTWQANPGRVWEEDEFWTELSWRIDPENRLGIREHFESPYRPGSKISVEEYYRWIFENSVPGLPERAAREQLSPLQYMRKFGTFEVTTPLPRLDAERSPFPTPSGRLEFYSRTLAEWGWPEHSLPGYIRSHVHWAELDRSQREFVLIPTFRLPTLIHTRSGNAKWLHEISNCNPVWMHPQDAADLKLETGDLLRVNTEIGYFVNRLYVTEGIRPGIVACSHHLGRWRLGDRLGTDRWASALVRLEESSDSGTSTLLLRQVEGVCPFASEDPDSSRIGWREAGVHQNLAFAVHPDPVSGMHCWHQKVKIQPAEPNDHYGDVFVDRQRSRAIYRHWMTMIRSAPGPGGLRRPLWLPRPLKPQAEAYRLE